MKTFISANSSVIKEKKEKISEDKILDIIKRFNHKILNSKKIEQNLNTSLDNVPVLNQQELLHLKKLADEMGWVIDMYEDNYNSFSYSLKLKEESKN